IPLTCEKLSPRRKLPAPTTTATCGPILHISAILLAIDSRDPPSIPNSPCLQKLCPDSFSNTRLYLLFDILLNAIRYLPAASHPISNRTNLFIFAPPPAALADSSKTCETVLLSSLTNCCSTRQFSPKNFFIF